MSAAMLLWGTVIHRPYVYAFFACYLFSGIYQLGWRRTGAYLVIAYLLALACELNSTRFGFPFGLYTYIDTTRTRELWISNVPFWDSLSFVFLSYYSWNLAGAILGKLSGWRTFLLSGLAMMLLDVVIDPLTLRGDRWFLGKIYYYPGGGSYFGVTLANFAGWFFVGALIPWVCQAFARRPAREPRGIFAWSIFGIYAGVFAFNVGITAWIGDWRLFAASLAVAAFTLGCTSSLLRRSLREGQAHA